MAANAGFDLERALRLTLKQAIVGHGCRKGCRFRDDAVEWLMQQPEWDAFVARLEEAEIECVDRRAA